MNKVSKYFPIVFLTVVLGAPAMRAQTQPPRIFFTDMISGPNTGGENNNGTILTIYGERFGATQGSSTVTVGGGAVAAYLQWGVAAPGELGTQKIAVAIGSAAATGNVVVTVNGQASNGVPFTVRSGNIYCVATTGSDSNTGQFPNQCWATLVKARTTIVDGDIIYAKNGVTQVTLDCFSGALCLSPGGSATSPRALIAYPGATVTVGTTSNPAVIDKAIRYDGGNNGINHWVIAGLTLTAPGQALLNPNVTDIRFIGNDASCPIADGNTPCVGTSGGTNVTTRFFGNYVHNVGNTCVVCKLQHALYLGSGVTDSVLAWNTVVPDPSHTGIGGCRAIQYRSSLADGSGIDDYDIHVHDNIVHDSMCDGINLVGMNPDAGPVEAYNNVVYHAGVNGVGGAVATCFHVDSSTSGHTAVVDIYNNSLYDCGADRGTAAGAFGMRNTNVGVRLRNNIILELSGEAYVEAAASGFCSAFSGSNNLWFGVGTPPCPPTFNSDLNVDPKYVDPVITRNFHLQSGSPAINAGVNTGILTDLDGVLRPQGTAYTMGAYEFVSGTSAQKPNPPTNLSAIVH